LEDFLKARQVKVKPLHQIDVDLFSSSVSSIEGYNHAVVFVDLMQIDLWDEDKGSDDQCGKEVVQLHC
jgi:hypothetical protein